MYVIIDLIYSEETKTDKKSFTFIHLNLKDNKIILSSE